MTSKARTRVTGWLRRRWWVVYLALLAASQGVVWWRVASAPGVPLDVVITEVAPTDEDGPVDGEAIRIASRRWIGPDARGQPIILIHGSPGSLTNFYTLGPVLARERRDVYALDMPGFGWSSHWVPSYSPRAHARAVLEWMDAHGIGRAHVLGWSQGGGVALSMADIAPDRVASMTLLGSVGLQEAEGSGSYLFEHAKYAVGMVVLVAGGELIPHFGLLGSLHFRYSFMCNFWETDQRDFRRVMETTDVATLIVQGREDFLVPAWGAEMNHEAMPASRLVMLDMDHFMPFRVRQAAIVAAYVVDHAGRHDAPDMPIVRGEFIADDASERPPSFGRVGAATVHAARMWPWWAMVLLIIAAYLVRAEIAAVVCASLVAGVDLDFGVALVGLATGCVVEAALCRRLGASRWVGHVETDDWARRLGRRPFRTMMVTRFLAERRRPAAAAGLSGWRAIAGTIVGAASWATLVLVVGSIAMGWFGLAWRDRFGWIGLVGGAVVTWWLVKAAQRAVTWTGRQQLKASVTRAIRYEFWPAKVFYAPLLAWTFVLGARHRGLLTFTCVNPGIANGGGTIGESKFEILRGFEQSDGRVLEATAIEPGDVEARVGALDAFVGRGVGYPVILKPDAAQRGRAVKLIRSRERAAAYFESMPRRAVAQAYHSGPNEAGVMWVRCDAGEGRAGSIFSITRKEFQYTVGDGRHTLEELILRDGRLRCQWRVFLQRFGAEASRVVAEGERVRLSIAGNHAQGAKFLDGAGLITRGLEDAIDELCATFRGVDGGELDFVRFDLRYETECDLAQGRFGIVELNGAMAESTNIYDPTWPVWRAYRVLFVQWATLYRLGAMRRAQGRRPMRWSELIVTAWRHFSGKRGPAVAD